MYGLEIQRRLRFQGFKVTPGQLYPALKKLEESGALESEEIAQIGANRIYYNITDKGKNALSKDIIEQLWYIEYMFTVQMQPYFNEIIKKSNIKKGDNVLDISNYMLEDLRQVASNLTQPMGSYTILCNEPRSKHLSEWVKEEKISGVSILHRNESQIPLSDNSIDCVIAFMNIHEEENWLLSEINRVLKLNGKALLLEVETEENHVKNNLLSLLFPSHPRTGVDLNQLIKEIHELEFTLTHESRERGIVEFIITKSGHS